MFYQKPIKTVFHELQSSRTAGLSSDEVSKRLIAYGKNELKQEKHFTVLKIFLSQFTDPIVVVLIWATLLSFFVGEFIDARVIAAIVILNALLGFFQEYRAEKSIQMLSKLSSPTAKVIRNWTQQIIPATELIPGDIVLFESGDKVCADIRIIESFVLAADESILTWESVPVNKNAETITWTVQLGERYDMLFSGTTITTGKATGIVTETWMQTELWKIANMVQSTSENITPLQKKLKTLGIQLWIIILVICGILFLIGILRQMQWFEMLLTSISLAVSAIPEWLPAVVTIVLALWVQKMYKKNVLVRKLKAIETLGSTTVICTDKTWTLTQNQMTVTDIFVNDHDIKAHHTGDGWHFSINDDLGPAKLGKIHHDELKLIFEIASNCNNAVLPNIGDPTELALLDVSSHGGVKGGQKKIWEIPFDSSTKFMITQHQWIEYLKWSPEVVLNMCTHIHINDKIVELTDQEKEKLLAKNTTMASKALRVLWFAYKTETKDFVFVWLMWMIDPPREEVYEALATCQKAWIRVIMITGDQKETAAQIAKDIGIKGEIMEGKDLEWIENRDWAIEHVNIYCRVNPEHKVKILTELQARGEIVAMTGDGVNDAPAIKKADIGISMSRKWTDVAREAADMVLVDDNFASIVNAVHYGRAMYDNIKKFVRLLLSANFDEILVITITIFAWLPLPMLPVQILWLNLVTDSLPAIALGLDPAEKNIMLRKPRSKKEHILSGAWWFIIITTIISTIISLFLFIWEYHANWIDKARTIVITVAIIFELFLVFTVRSDKYNIWELKTNRYVIGSVAVALWLHLLVMYTPLHIAFKFTPLSFINRLQIIGLSSRWFVFWEIVKIAKKRKKK